MSHDDFRLSRRKALAALGTIGAASAGAGLGTSAYFSDQETFENNRLVAGRLDLKVDWEEHYSDWSADEADAVGDVVMPDGDPSAVPVDYVGLPDPEYPLVAVPNTDLGDFMDATAIEAYPDTDNDGIQDPIPSDTTACEYLADVGNDDAGLDPAGPRTDNDDTNVDGEAAPLVAVEDVKPGDFGELTLSFHLCDNPGYVWLNGSLDYNAENDVTEPEADDPDENNDLGDFDDMMDGELLNAIQTRLWYDDGDNVVEDGEEYITPEMSLGNLLCVLDMNNGLPLCAAGGGIVGDPGDDDGDGGGTGTQTCQPVDDYDSVHTTGQTVTVDNLMGDGIDYTIEKNPKCNEDFGLVEAFKTDEAPEGQPTYGAQETSKTYETVYGDFTVYSQLVDGVQTVTGWEFTPTDGTTWCVAKVIVKGGNEGANVYSYDNPDGDSDFTNDAPPAGATGHDDTMLQTPTGQEISHVDFCLQMIEPTGDPGGDPGDDTGDIEQDDPCCFAPSTSHYVGFAWWLPVDHANELQSDGVGFDLGFYTEQCRHNDGSGMNNDAVDPEEYDA